MTWENGRGYHFGLEAEYLLVDAHTFRPLWHRDLSFDVLNAALESIPVGDLPPLDGLDLEKPHRKLMPFTVEGYHVPAPDLSPIDLLPKGVEIRTPVCASIESCMECVSVLHERMQNALAELGYRAVAVSHHPVEDHFDGPHNKRRHDFWQWAMLAMTTYGPDINVSLPAPLNDRLVPADLHAKVNYYAPALTALSLASPFCRGDLWKIRGRLGKSIRTHRRSVIAPAIELHPEEAGRLEFKTWRGYPHRRTAQSHDWRGAPLLFHPLLGEGPRGDACPRVQVRARCPNGGRTAERTLNSLPIRRHSFNCEGTMQRRTSRRGDSPVALAALALIASTSTIVVARDEGPPLVRVATIALKGPAGGLDHLALDERRGRLFVANTINNTLDIVDLKAGKLLKQVSGQGRPRGVAYSAESDWLFIGNGTGGVCNVLGGETYDLIKSLPLGEDADNVRYNARTGRAYVVHADKELAVFDTRSFALREPIALPKSLGALQLETARPRLYVNAKAADAVVVIDTDSDTVIGRYPVAPAGVNAALAIDETNRRLFVGCRRAPSLVVMDADSGKAVARLPIPGDVDDVSFDARRRLIFASCGEGKIATIRQTDADHYEAVATIPTAEGARTSTYDAQSGRLYLAVPRRAERPDQKNPEVWVYQARP